MKRSALETVSIDSSSMDPAIIFENFRGCHATELLTIAVQHLRLFDLLDEAPRSESELGQMLELAPRPLTVLLTALRAMGLVRNDGDTVRNTELGKEHLVSKARFSVADYVGLAADSPCVLGMLDLLRSNRPAGSDAEEGTAFIFKDGMDSAMEKENSARHFTLALAGRAKIVAPHLAKNVPIADGLLVDLGGGTGIYSLAYLESQESLRAIVLDSPEVVRVAAEFASEYESGDRLELVEGDMFSSDIPPCETILLSNILHDWDVPECRALVARCAEALRPGGQLIIHDVFLNDALDGPLPIALYSASLFSFTEGRAYSAAEYRTWLTEAGLLPRAEITPTLIHCGALVGQKPAV